MATQFPIDPEFNRFVEGVPADADGETEGVEVDLQLEDTDIEELPDGSAVVRLDTNGPMDNEDFYENLADSDVVDPVKLSSRLGDPVLGAIIGLVGPPPMTPQEFVAYQPGYGLGALAKITVPVGSYDEDQFVNVGSNRWALQLGTPMAWYFGRSFLDPALTTIELLPSVHFFGDNDDPRGASSTSQDALLRIEAHLTRNVHKAVWVSLDGQYVYGGETSTDGRSNDDTQRAFELGGTVNVSFSLRASVKLSYGEVVSRNDEGPDGRMVRLIGNFAF